MIFIVINSFHEGQVNHYVCMLYKFYIILVGISLIFIDQLEEEDKNSGRRGGYSTRFAEKKPRTDKMVKVEDEPKK